MGVGEKPGNEPIASLMALSDNGTWGANGMWIRAHERRSRVWGICIQKGVTDPHPE